jgi:demethylmenaquinone methyltransferase/2-methoxy-6-polyprenyl-1,4-benzoquinol methylase
MSKSTIQEQIAYYRARAGEYDEWFYRIGRYDQGETLNRQWFAEAEFLMQRLHALGPVDNALEVACGTGIWTRELHKISTHITALDAAPEVLDINRSKLGDPTNIDYRQVDIFEWEPDHEYDLVIFCFWLSHVPPDQLEPFLHKVYRATKPGGQLFMVDSRRIQSGTAKDNPIVDRDDYLQTRWLKDGRQFEVVKIFYDKVDLQAAFENAGFVAEVGYSDNYFIYAQASKPAPIPD